MKLSFASLALAPFVASFLPASEAACTGPSSSTQDDGYADDYRGWYDVSGCGKAMDYCRWVGNSGSGGNPAISTTHDSSSWKCRLAGTDETYSAGTPTVFPFLKVSDTYEATVPSIPSPARRYLFNQGGNTLIQDVGTLAASAWAADATIRGKASDGTIWGSDYLILDPMKVRDDPAYVHFPRGVVDRNWQSITTEAWYMTMERGETWSRIFDFGVKETGPGTTFCYWTLTAQLGDQRWRQRLEVKDATGGWRTIDFDTHMTEYSWHHFATVIDRPSNKLKLYMDGTEKASVDLNINWDSVYFDDNYLGKSLYPADNPTYGAFGEFRIYDKALTPDQLSRNYQNAPTRSIPARKTLRGKGAKCDYSEECTTGHCFGEKWTDGLDAYKMCRGTTGTGYKCSNDNDCKSGVCREFLFGAFKECAECKDRFVDWRGLCTGNQECSGWSCTGNNQGSAQQGEVCFLHANCASNCCEKFLPGTLGLCGTICM